MNIQSYPYFVQRVVKTPGLIEKIGPFHAAQSPHPHVHWLTTNSNLGNGNFPLGQGVVPCYVGTMRIASFHMKAMDIISYTLFNDIISKANKMLETANVCLRVRFRVSFNQRMQHAHAMFDPTQPGVPEILERNHKFYGIPGDQQRALVKQIDTDVNAYLGDYSEDFTRDNFEALKKKLTPYFTKMKIELRKKFDVKPDPFVLSSEDRQFLNLTDKEEINFLEMSCYNYAFLRVRESRAIPFIKANTFIFLDAVPFTGLFASWGYRQLDVPQEGYTPLKAGDLIAYVTTPDEKEKGDITSAQLTHLAVYLRDGLAISKMGISEPTLSTHRLSDVMGSYGRHLLFFRKINP